MAKDAGYKVVAHMMPDLPNVDLERDVEQFIVSLVKNYCVKFYLICFIRSFLKIQHSEQMV